MCEISEKIYQEGIEQGKLEQQKETARSLSKVGMPLEKIAEVLKVNVQIVQEWLTGNAAKIM